MFRTLIWGFLAHCAPGLEGSTLEAETKLAEMKQKMEEMKETMDEIKNELAAPPTVNEVPYVVSCAYIHRHSLIGKISYKKFLSNYSSDGKY